MSAYMSYVELAAEVRRAYLSGDWDRVDELIALPTLPEKLPKKKAAPKPKAKRIKKEAKE